MLIQPVPITKSLRRMRRCYDGLVWAEPILPLAERVLVYQLHRPTAPSLRCLRLICSTTLVFVSCACDGDTGTVPLRSRKKDGNMASVTQSSIHFLYNYLGEGPLTSQTP
jgi:hypothetical protein